MIRSTCNVPVFWSQAQLHVIHAAIKNRETVFKVEPTDERRETILVIKFSGVNTNVQCGITTGIKLKNKITL